MALLPGLAAAVGIGFALSDGVLAATINAQGEGLEASAGAIVGVDAGAVITEIPAKEPNGDGKQWVLRLGIRDGAVTDLCVTQHASLLGRTVTLVIHADSAKLSNVVLDVEHVAGNIHFQGNIYLNRRGDQIPVPGTPIQLGGRPDDLGLGAGGAVLNDIAAGVRAAELVGGTASIPNVDLSVVFDDYRCPVPTDGNPGR